MNLDDFILASDAGNASLALTRALAYATANDKTIRLNRMYPYSTTVPLPSGARIVGDGRATGFVAPANTPVTLFATRGATSDIYLRNFALDGGVTSAMTTKSYTRGMRFIGASGVCLENMHISNCADWAVSFEQSSDISVENHHHHGGGLGLPGGRDGLHFLDCSNVRVDGADIWSGDDCIGITTSTAGTGDISTIRVRNVTGRSDIANVVTVGQETACTYGVSDLSIENVSTKAGGSQCVVQISVINAGAVLSGIKLSGVKGTANAGHAIYIAGKSGSTITDVSVTDCDVIGAVQHGIYLTHVDSFTVAGAGKSLAGMFAGITLYNCTRGYVKPRSRGSSMWGLQVNSCSDVTIDTPVLLDNGANNYAARTGGNLRIVNSTDVSVLDGTASGATDTSYYGASLSGNTNLRISAATRLAGNIPITPTARGSWKSTAIGASDPLVTSDSAAGYSVGDPWVNTTTKALFICVDATPGVAVWHRLA